MTEPAPIVLVVDDEVQIRRFLRAGLELDGFTVQDAETGADALKWVTLKQPDLIILDLGLPDMDGADVLERLRAWSSVPLIVLSVRSNEAEKVRLLESGADDYVVKPFGMAELLARAHAAMRRHVRVSTGEHEISVKGAQTESQLRSLYSKSTIFAATSRYEPTGLASIEAAFSRCALVANDTEVYRELWGDAALYFERNNADSLSEVLSQLDEDRELTRLYGTRAYNRARERFTARRIASPTRRGSRNSTSSGVVQGRSMPG